MGKMWNELVGSNPMLIEINRFRRRYFTFSGANSLNGVVLALCLICYATLVLIVVQNRASTSPIVLIIFETGLLTIFAPMMLYGAIAGERERRSWDLLMAAPVSKAQIVAGKFIGATAALGIGVLVFQLPIGIATAYYQGVQFRFVLDAQLVSISFLICVCALTLLLSARVKRSLMALGATLGCLMSFLVLLPVLVGIGGSDPHMTDLTFYLHPFYVLNRLQDVARHAYEVSVSKQVAAANGYSVQENISVPSIWWGWPQILLYLAFAAIMLVWATKTLNFAENEVKFLPQGQKDA